MPSHPRPWHRGSEFGDGARVPLCRERRAQWRARVELFRRAGRLTALHAEVGRALLRRLAVDGRCDPSHATLATDAGASPRTVRRALDAFAACGLVTWTRRLVRAGWRAAQTSSAYILRVGDAAPIQGPRCGGQADRGTLLDKFSLSAAPAESKRLGDGKGRLSASAPPPSCGSDEWARCNAARQIAALQAAADAAA